MATRQLGDLAARGSFEPAGGWRGDHHDGVPVWISSRREPRLDSSRWPLVSYADDLVAAARGSSRASRA